MTSLFNWERFADNISSLIFSLDLYTNSTAFVTGCDVIEKKMLNPWPMEKIVAFWNFSIAGAYFPHSGGPGVSDT